ncbi:hypothetical protein GY45DRAFT_1432604, partial [Cubamyces sp. BRFM 1775]
STSASIVPPPAFCRLSVCASCPCKRPVSWQRHGLQLSLWTLDWHHANTFLER